MLLEEYILLKSQSLLTLWVIYFVNDKYWISNKIVNVL